MEEDSTQPTTYFPNGDEGEFAEGLPHPAAFLDVLNHHMPEGQRIPLEANRSYAIGRSVSSSSSSSSASNSTFIRINHPSVSSLHAEIIHLSNSNFYIAPKSARGVQYIPQSSFVSYSGNADSILLLGKSREDKKSINLGKGYGPDPFKSMIQLTSCNVLQSCAILLFGEVAVRFISAQDAQHISAPNPIPAPQKAEQKPSSNTTLGVAEATQLLDVEFSDSEEDGEAEIAGDAEASRMSKGSDEGDEGEWKNFRTAQGSRASSPNEIFLTPADESTPLQLAQVPPSQQLLRQQQQQEQEQEQKMRQAVLEPTQLDDEEGDFWGGRDMEDEEPAAPTPAPAPSSAPAPAVSSASNTPVVTSKFELEKDDEEEAEVEQEKEKEKQKESSLFSDDSITSSNPANSQQMFAALGSIAGQLPMASPPHPRSIIQREHDYSPFGRLAEDLVIPAAAPAVSSLPAAAAEVPSKKDDDSDATDDELDDVPKKQEEKEEEVKAQFEEMKDVEPQPQPQPAVSAAESKPEAEIKETKESAPDASSTSRAKRKNEEVSTSAESSLAEQEAFAFDSQPLGSEADLFVKPKPVEPSAPAAKRPRRGQKATEPEPEAAKLVAVTSPAGFEAATVLSSSSASAGASSMNDSEMVDLSEASLRSQELVQHLHTFSKSPVPFEEESKAQEEEEAEEEQPAAKGKKKGGRKPAASKKGKNAVAAAAESLPPIPAPAPQPAVDLLPIDDSQFDPFPSIDLTRLATPPRSPAPVPSAPSLPAPASRPTRGKKQKEEEKPKAEEEKPTPEAEEEKPVEIAPAPKKRGGKAAASAAASKKKEEAAPSESDSAVESEQEAEAKEAKTAKGKGRGKQASAAAAASSSSAPETPARGRGRGAAVASSIVSASAASPSSSQAGPSPASTKKRSPSKADKQSFKIVFTRLDPKPYANDLKKLKHQLLDNAVGCDVLVTDVVFKSIKFLNAMSQGIPIVHAAWIEASSKVSHWLDPEDFIIPDARPSLEKARKNLQQRILSGLRFWLSSEMNTPDFKSLIATAGGELDKSAVPGKESYIIMKDEEELKKLKNIKGKVYNKHLLMDSILSQEINSEDPACIIRE